MRFTVGTVVLAPFAFRRGFRRPGVAVTARDFATAAVIFGIVGFAGYWFQNAGLERTSTSNSAFITGLFVVFTPLIEVAVTRRAPDRRVVLPGVGFALGLFFLSRAAIDIRAGGAPPPPSGVLFP